MVNFLNAKRQHVNICNNGQVASLRPLRYFTSMFLDDSRTMTGSFALLIAHFSMETHDDHKKMHLCSTIIKG